MDKQQNIKRSSIVLAITASVMVIEIVGGYVFNSMALLADGWHMGTHTIAIGITVFAYKYARQKNSDLTFTFGTWKVEVLGGYTSAILLIVIAASMGFESMERLYEPRDIDFKYALPIAFVGLITNVLCMLVLGHHDHGLEKHHHYRHQDLNCGPRTYMC